MEIKISEVKLPASLIEKIYDATGSLTGGNKGLILFFVDEKGEPTVLIKTENNCVKLALHKLMETYLNNLELTE
jgi:hypothetical protein